MFLCFLAAVYTVVDDSYKCLTKEPVLLVPKELNISSLYETYRYDIQRTTVIYPTLLLLR